MPTDITTRVVRTIRDVTGDDDWCSRAQVDSLMGATTIDKREVDRALKRAVAEGRLEQDGDQYRPTDEA
ncbi:hypothetical protein [Haloarcula sp. JP-L23]|uniref:hypothetical protein n=1 Tax=Haloarcula sp. JP-L23 TaxID=2716717 RepID=UPI00140ED4CF|nr:hypothetical protein G9465_08405 [Haloarcula sp. JP-L23]